MQLKLKFRMEKDDDNIMMMKKTMKRNEMKQFIWLWHFVLFCIKKHWKVLWQFCGYVNNTRCCVFECLCFKSIRLFRLHTCICICIRSEHTNKVCTAITIALFTKKNPENSFDLIAVMTLETNCCIPNRASCPKTGFICHLQCLSVD